MAKLIEVDVVIIGGGVSGLTAAYNLHKKNNNIKLAILEARDKIGGRTWSPQLKAAGGKMGKWDLGGQWVGKTQTHVLELLHELGIETYAQHISGTHMAILKPAGKLVKYKGDDMPGTVCGEIDAWNLFRKLQDMSKNVPLDNPFKHKEAEDWNTESLQMWLDRKGWTMEGREAVQLLVESTLDSPTTEISVLFFLMYLNSAGSDIDIFTGDSGNGAQGYRIDGGAQSICDTLVNRLPSNTVFLNAPVTSVEQKDNQVTVTTKNSAKFKAKYAIVAVPPKQICSIKFFPYLEGPKQLQLKNYYPKGKGTKFVITYNSAFWRDVGWSGQITSVEGQKDPLTGELLPSILTFDACTHDGLPALMGFSDLTADIPMQRRKQLNIKVIQEFYGEKAESEVADYLDCCWSSEDYIGGCVASVDAGHMEHDYSDLLRLPVGRVHWAGTETATVWLGYINGAVQAGTRAANEICI